MEQNVIEFRNKRLESLIISAAVDMANASQMAEQALALSLVSNDLIISAGQKMEDIYILFTENDTAEEK